MERFASYRAAIKRMSEENPVVMMQGNIDELSSAQEIGASPFLPLPEILEEKEEAPRAHKQNPYRAYLARRRKVYIAQAVVFLILATIFIVWMALLKQRS